MESLFNRRRMSRVLAVLLRVPPIILMDMISNSKYCFSLDGWRIFMYLGNFVLHVPLYLQSKSFLNEIYLPRFEDAAYFSLQSTGYLGALLLFCQRIHNLVIFYLSIAAVGVIIWSYILNVEYVKYCSTLLIEHSSLQHELFVLNKKALQVFLFNYVSQTFLAIVFCFSTISLPNFPHKKFLVGVLFIFPTLINAALPSTVLTVAPDIVGIITFFVFIYYFAIHLRRIPQFLWFYATSFSFPFHLMEVLNRINIMWTEYQVTNVLQTFAMLRLLKNIVLLTSDYIFTEYTVTRSFDVQQLTHIFSELTVISFENIIAILGITTILSLIIDKTVYCIVQNILFVPVLERDNISSMFTKLLVLLCIQFGVPSLEHDERLSMICKISWMMSVSVLSKINIQICKQLISVTLIGSLNFKRHLSVLSLAIVTLIACYVWLDVIVKLNMYETWLFLVVIFNIEIYFTLFICLITYVLNLIHYHSYTPWYEMYDYVFYLEATKNIMSLIFSILVLVKGFLKLFEVGSLLRLVFLILHTYYHVYLQVVKGYRKYKARRLISNCVCALPLATEEELSEMGGACAICLTDACRNIICITRCNHFFHTYCLRKWLSERNVCPICFRRIIIHNHLLGSNRIRARQHQD